MAKAYLGRHSKTGSKADVGGDDNKRRLTEDGKVLCGMRSKALGDVQFDWVGHSPKHRTRETAELVCVGHVSEGTPFVEIAALFSVDPEIEHEIDVLFDRLGYAPFSEYLADPKGAEVMPKFGSLAREAIDAKIAELGGENIYLCAHAVLNNAVAMAYADEEGKAFMANHAIEDCGIIEIDLETGKITPHEPVKIPAAV